MGRHAAAFSGYGQQDSQEFLLFLLDGLQEDLNRIHKKPYIEKPDSTDEMVHDQKALRDMADKCWDIYKARNDSVVTDLFAGMYKSTLVCPVCDKVSIIFDPFNNLTLQLPIESLWTRDIFVFPIAERPIRIAVDIDRNANFFQLKEYVAKKLGSDPRRLVTSELYKHRFFKMFNDKTTIGEERIANSDVIGMFEVDKVPTNYPPPKKKGQKIRSMLNTYSDDDEDVPAEGDESPLAERILVPVFNRVGKEGSSRFQSKSLFATPQYIVLDRSEIRDPDQILRKLLIKVQTMTTTDLLDGNGSDVEDSDGVMMNADDADSSTDSKIQAASIQSEEGMVDISMREPSEETPSAPVAGPRISYPPQIPKSEKAPSALPKVLRRGGDIPDNLRRLFNVSIMHTTEMVPTGWGTLQDEGKKYPFLSARVSERDRKLKRARRARQRGAAALQKQQQRASSDSSDTSSDEDADNILPAAGRTVASDYPSGNTSPAEEDEHVARLAFSTFSRTTPRDRCGLIRTPPLGQFNNSSADNTPQQSSPDDADPDDGDDDTTQEPEEPLSPLLGLGEALILEWDPTTHESLFSPHRHLDDLRGFATWEDCPLIPDLALDARRAARQDRRRHGVSLDDCLDEFRKPEILSENDAWYCPRCKEHRRASKTFELWKAPDILVVHLKRFSAQGRLRDKLDIHVEFPTEGLDLSDRVAVNDDGKSLVYDLFAVDNHYGGLGGGHYTAFARNFIDGNWYEYNGEPLLLQYSSMTIH